MSSESVPSDVQPWVSHCFPKIGTNGSLWRLTVGELKRLETMLRQKQTISSDPNPLPLCPSSRNKSSRIVHVARYFYEDAACTRPNQELAHELLRDLEHMQQGQTNRASVTNAAMNNSGINTSYINEHRGLEATIRPSPTAHPGGIYPQYATIPQYTEGSVASAAPQRQNSIPSAAAGPSTNKRSSEVSPERAGSQGHTWRPSRAQDMAPKRLRIESSRAGLSSSSTANQPAFGNAGAFAAASASGTTARVLPSSFAASTFGRQLESFQQAQESQLDQFEEGIRAQARAHVNTILRSSTNTAATHAASTIESPPNPWAYIGSTGTPSQSGPNSSSAMGSGLAPGVNDPADSSEGDPANASVRQENDAAEAKLISDLNAMGFTDENEIRSAIQHFTTQSDGTPDIDAEVVMVHIISLREEAEDARQMDEARLASEKIQAEEQKQKPKMSDEERLITVSVAEMKRCEFSGSIILNRLSESELLTCTDANESKKEFIRLLLLEKKCRKWYSELWSFYFEELCRKLKSLPWISKNGIRAECDKLDSGLNKLSEQQNGVPRIFIEARKNVENTSLDNGIPGTGEHTQPSGQPSGEPAARAKASVAEVIEID